MIDGLNDEHRASLIDVLSANKNVQRIVLFGSRATETYSVTSDIDIALFGNELSRNDVSRLGASVDELPYPHKVDLLSYKSIRNDSLRDEIDDHGVVWFNRGSAADSGEWLEMTLGDACTKIGSGATPRGGKEVYLVEGPYSLIRSQNVYNDGFRHEGLASIGEKHAAELSNVKVQPNDVLLNITGDSVARSCLVSSDVLPARVNQHVAIIRTDQSKLDSLYLRYFLVNPETQTLLLSWAGSGGTRNALTKSMIESLTVKAPPLPEQRRIAHILGTLDDKIELNRRMNETLEEMARAVFKDWFVDFGPVRAKMEGREAYLPEEVWGLFPDRLVESELGEVPEGWGVVPLGDVCHKPQYGYTASANDDPVGPKFLRITDINKRAWVEWRSVPFCEIGEADFDKYRLCEGDVLIARMADPGHGVMIEENANAVFASYLIRFRAMNGAFSRLLQYWLRSDGYWELVKSRGAGTTRTSLNAKVLSSFPLVVPTESIAASFSDLVRQWRAKVVSNTHASTRLTELRDGLLPELVAGKTLIEKHTNDRGRILT